MNKDLSQLGDNPVIEGAIYASMTETPRAEKRPVMYGDERADALFAAAYCAEASRVFESWARRHKEHADALGIKEAGQS